MLDLQNEPLIAVNDHQKIYINPAMLNRHGLVTGATGTGKSTTLITLAETFSSLGIPVFMADVKGDLGGIARSAVLAGKPARRIGEFGLDKMGWKPAGCPVVFWDVHGKNGHPLRATISETGPLILGRLLNLNDVQNGVLRIIFKIADEMGWLLLDLKDLRAMAQHVGDERDAYKTSYGQISPASIGAIQRALLKLEEEGGDLFFGEPALNIKDLLHTENGRGVINLLDASRLINSPDLYACVCLWLLSELYERLPECGDLQKPKLVFFFDEAHLLFNDIVPAMLQKIEQIVRLIRSRGVGIFFISQNPADMPDNILGQLGNRIQHALRAFTPKDKKAVKAAAESFRPNPAFSAVEVIGELATGEAIVSFLDGEGSPQISERAFIIPPQCKSGPLEDGERQKLMASSWLHGVYDNAVDRESAYEILAAKAAKINEENAREKDQKSQSKESGKLKIRTAASREMNLEDILGNALKQAGRTAGNAVGRELGKTLLRGILGGLMSKR